MKSSNKIVFFVASFSSIEATAPLGILAISTPLLEAGYDVRIIDSTITPEEESKATVIVQFSDSYFNLAGMQNTEYNQYLSLPEPVTVKLDGKVYQIDPVKQEPAR